MDHPVFQVSLAGDRFHSKIGYTSVDSRLRSRTSGMLGKRSRKEVAKYRTHSVIRSDRLEQTV